MVKGHEKSVKQTPSSVELEMPLKRFKMKVNHYKKLHEMIEKLC